MVFLPVKLSECLTTCRVPFKYDVGIGTVSGSPLVICSVTLTIIGKVRH